MVGWMDRLFTGRRRRRERTYALILRRYDAFLQILRANNEALELFSDLESAAQESGPAGMERLRGIVTRLSVQVFAMAAMLQRLAEGRYGELTEVADRLGRDLVAALGPPPEEALHDLPLVIPFVRLEPFRDAQVGGKNANLSRVLPLLDAAVPPGFAVSLAAFRAFLSANGLENTVRVLWDTLDPDEPGHLVEVGRSLREIVLSAPLPDPLRAALEAETGKLAAKAGAESRFAVRSSASGEDAAFSFAGQYTSVIGVGRDQVPEAYRSVLAGFFNPRAVMLRLRRGFGALELGMGAQVMVMVEPRAAGVSYSRNPSLPDSRLVRVEAVAGAGAKLVEGSATPVAYDVDLEDAGPPREEGGLLSREEILAAARLAVEAERALEAPADVEWSFDARGRLWLLQARPLALRPSYEGTAPSCPEPGREIIVEGGRCASAGAASGVVFVARGGEEALGSPAGCVLVAPEASPELALVLSRVRAVVTERGGVSGHLASVAREFAVPALFGLEGAMSKLTRDETVTVDASSGRIYRGEVEPLSRGAAPKTRLAAPPGPAAEAARKLLPLVLPLTLTDPAAPAFTPEGCTTLHDVVRFIHEKALAETVSLPDLWSGAGAAGGIRLREPLPLDLRILPLGSGIEGAPEGGRIGLDQISSAPASALLRGLSDPALRRSGPRPVDAAGLISVMAGGAAGDAALGAPSWALVADRYLHLSSRIGYHFATVEAFAGPREGDNRVRFVFKGGAADERRRRRRAAFLAAVLEGLGFQVRLKTDFVAASYGQAPESSIRSLLETVGRLLACSGQLDMMMGSDGQIAWYAECFLAGRYGAILDAEPPPDIH